MVGLGDGPGRTAAVRPPGHHFFITPPGILSLNTPIFAKMFRLILALFIGLAGLSPASSQPANWQAFVPVGFLLLDSVSGDLNKDGKKDMLIVLQSQHEPDSMELARPLLILFGKTGGGYELAVRNDSTVMCRGCGGVFGDPYAGLVVKNNFFSIEHYGGSSWRWTRIITFRYDAGTRRFLLHRDAGESFHTSDPEKRELHVYNKELYGKLLFADYSYHQDW